MISIVIGKPGSGKTYHMVRYLYDVLVELLKKKDIERRIYTNISVNIDEFNAQLSKAFKQNIDVSNLLLTLEPEDLKYNPRLLSQEDRIEKRVAGKSYFSIAANSQAFFWNRFEDNALIIIDEIQKYLSTVKEESESEKQSLIEYFSLHRHRRHDWFFVTQNLSSLPIEIRRVSEKVYNVFNAKSMSIGFPINVPLRDIETLLAGFNVTRQLYRVREGYLESTFRPVYEDAVEVVIMEKRVFRLYQTHTQLTQASSATMFRGDSALPFDLGPGQRRRAVLWFLGKHGFHLGIKLGIVIWFIVGIYSWVSAHTRDNTKDEKLPVNQAIVDEQLQEASADQDSIPTIQEPPSILQQPKHSEIIYNRVMVRDGVTYRIGDIIDGKRISDINARKGVVYEYPEKIYFDGFILLDDLRRLSCGRVEQKEL